MRRLFPPERLTTLITQVNHEITTRRYLNRARRHRSYPRVIKRARHNSYRVKQSHDHGTVHTGPPTTTLINLS
jgi:hypothetical protein